MEWIMIQKVTPAGSVLNGIIGSPEAESSEVFENEIILVWIPEGGRVKEEIHWAMS